jgi:RND family efflux transporter MFP subunit
MAAVLLAAACAKADGGKKSAGDAVTPAAVAVETAPVRQTELSDGVEVVGTLAAKFSAEVKSEVSGRISRVHVAEWSRVRQGDPLAEVDSREMEQTRNRTKAALEAARSSVEMARQGVVTAAAGEATARAAVETAKAGLAEAGVARERAEREYARLKGLSEEGLVTRQALDEGLTARDAVAARIRTLEAQVASAERQAQGAAAQVGVAEAQVRLAEAQVKTAEEELAGVEIRLAKTVIRAPFDGTVAERLVNVGEVVGEMQKVVFRLVDNRVLTLTVSVPSAEIGRVNVGQSLSFTLDAFPGRSFPGRITHANPSVDAADRSLRVTAEIPNVPEVLKGGLFARGFIETGRRPGVLLVPRTALFNWDAAAGRADILVADGQTARRRSVVVGATRDAEVEVVSGLVADDRVVVRGGFKVKDGSPIKTTGAGEGA